jgi:hypothetical protein
MKFSFLVEKFDCQAWGNSAFSLKQVTIKYSSKIVNYFHGEHKRRSRPIFPKIATQKNFSILGLGKVQISCKKFS